MNTCQITLFTLIATLALSGPASAGLDDWLGVLKGDKTSSTPSGATGLGSLTQTEMTGALKQALEKGVQHAVTQLGQPGGFLDNARVRIPLPEKLTWVESALRTVGQGELADEFVASMNNAAEQAVPEVASIFSQTIQSMSLQDAKGILQGPDNAATEYFREHSSAALRERMMPIIQQATDSAGVTAHYKSMMDKAGGFAGLLNQDNLDLDRYVTDKAMDGLFLMIADEEKKIRENPVERSTELLKKVFGAE